MRSAPVPAGTIVVGVDGSTSADEAVRWAVEEAIRAGRDLTLAHAARDDHGVPPLPFNDRTDESDSRVAEARDILARAERTARTRADLLANGSAGHGRRPRIDAVLRIDKPRAALIELSARAALIVLGSRGRGAIGSRLLGSVGLAVTDRAACPVVVVRPHAAGGVRHGVLVGVDGTERSKPALEFAFRQASLRRLPLTVLYCYEDMVSDMVGPGLVADGEPDMASRRLLLAETTAGMGEDYPDVHTKLEIARGRPGDCLARMSRRMHLVVVGTEHMSRLAKVWAGDVSAQVVERAHSVVAVIPTAAATDAGDAEAEQVAAVSAADGGER